MFIRIPWPPPHFSRPLALAPFSASSGREQLGSRRRLSTANNGFFRRLRRLRPKISNNSKPGVDKKTQGCNESLEPTIVITPVPRTDADEGEVEIAVPAVAEPEDGEWESCSDNDEFREPDEEEEEEEKGGGERPREPWPVSLWASVPLSFVTQDLRQTVPRNLVRRPHTHRRKLACGMYKWQVTRLNTIEEVGWF